MKLWLRIALILLLVAVLGGVVGRALSKRDPVYQGKPLSFWLKGFELDDYPGRPSFNEAVDAVRDAGTNAVPILLHLLQVRDSDWKYRLIRLARKQDFIKSHYVSADTQNWAARQGFLALNHEAADYAVPSLIEISRQDILRGETNSLRHGYITEILEVFKTEDKEREIKRSR